MGEYSQYISSVRRSVSTPKELVKDGKCVFGTFDKEFETMELLKIKHPTSAPDFLNKYKLTLWEAVEVHLEEGVLVTALSDMGLFGIAVAIFYDKRTKKVTSWSTNLKSHDTRIAPNLLNGSITEGETSSACLRYVNNFQDGKCSLSGRQKDADNSIEFAFDLERISKPCVVSIPFADPAERCRPLYSQKDFFRATGTLTFNGETFHTTAESTAIVDDHKGYYPRHAHYDWLTSMGVNTTDGKKKFLAFNLTRNQSVDQDKYNENLIWFKDNTSLLPPVHFTRSPETRDFKDGALWKVVDEHDMVNIRFHVSDLFRMIVHARPVAAIDYFVTFGELEGYVRDEDGTKYMLDGMTGIGEDKTLLL